MGVLAEARVQADGSGLVFLIMRGNVLPEMALSKLVKEICMQAVPHGFRSSFREWCGETGAPREVAGAALAHAIENKAGAGYARSDLFNRRRALMQDWMDYMMSTSEARAAKGAVSSCA